MPGSRAWRHQKAFVGHCAVARGRGWLSEPLIPASVLS
jgi:hypothetical protein